MPSPNKQGTPETEHSWFPGYAWTIANCRHCYSHLGWRFDAVQGSGLQPARFWGLRRPSLISDVGSSDGGGGDGRGRGPGARQERGGGAVGSGEGMEEADSEAAEEQSSWDGAHDAEEGDVASEGSVSEDSDNISDDGGDDDGSSGSRRDGAGQGGGVTAAQRTLDVFMEQLRRLVQPRPDPQV